jgi:Cu2+-exporting ATPase
MGTLDQIRDRPQLADDISRYLRPSGGGAQQFDVMVKGASCAGCIAKIERGVKALPGIENARLNLSTGKLAVTGIHLSPAAILHRVQDLGYGAQPFDAGEILDEGEKQSRILLLCLAVSGFATVFTMGLTDAVWYGGDELGVAARQGFFWLAGAIAVPATLYSAQPFFQSAWRSLKAGRAGMDVPISLALLLSLGLSLYQTYEKGAQTYFDASVMLTFLLLIGRYLDHRLRDRARGAARHLLAMQTLLVRRVKPNGGLETVSAREVRPGDVILLASGDRSPVNGVLADRGTEVDMSLVTGESLPQFLAQGMPLQAGSIVTGSPVQLRATAAVEDSLLADLARLLEAGQQVRNHYVRIADRAARAYVPAVFILAISVMLGWLAVGASFSAAITNAITVLVITCPCALGLAVPAVQIVATERLFRHGIFVKSGDALERLAQIRMVIFDKTGTLTLGTPVLANRADIPPEILSRAASLASVSRHPLARAVATAWGGAVSADAGVREVPGSGLERGEGENSERLGNAAWCGAPEGGLYPLWYRRGQEPPVGFRFEDRTRPESRALVSALKARGLGVEMLTGDTPAIAARIAEEVGIKDWRAAVRPEEKAAQLQELAKAGTRALMVGDGINDAAALALAHVSMAPGTATDISQKAADMVLRGDDLKPIAEAIDVARKAQRLVLENFGLALVYNLTAIPLAALGIVTPLVAAATMAGSSLLVTLNALRLAGRRAA